MKIHSVVPMKMFSLRFAPRFSGSCWRTECADLHLRNHNHLRLMSLRMCVCPSSWSFHSETSSLNNSPISFIIFCQRHFERRVTGTWSKYFAAFANIFHLIALEQWGPSARTKKCSFFYTIFFFFSLDHIYMANISFGTAALAICICSYSAE